MQEISVRVTGDTLAIRRADGVTIESACGTDNAALSATELLAASLASCITASIMPLLSRHGAGAAGLGIVVAANDPLARGFDVRIALPACEDELLARCKRAVAKCPVLRALNIPVDIQWQMN